MFNRTVDNAVKSLEKILTQLADIEAIQASDALAYAELAAKARAEAGRAGRIKTKIQDLLA